MTLSPQYLDLGMHSSYLLAFHHWPLLLSELEDQIALTSQMIDEIVAAASTVGLLDVASTVGLPVDVASIAAAATAAAN